MHIFNNILCDIEWKLNTAVLTYCMRAVKLTEKIPRRYDHILNPMPTELPPEGLALPHFQLVETK